MFVGAGISKISNGPTWDELADNLLEQLIKHEVFTYKTIDQLKGLDAKKKISIAIDAFKVKKVPPPDFRNALRIDQLEQADIHKDIYSMGTSVVTTNYDECLDALAMMVYPPKDSKPTESRIDGVGSEEMPGLEIGSRSYNKVLCHIDDMTIEKLNNPGCILHLHGSVKAPETMILTTRQYLEHYSDDRIQTLLENLFRDHTVLFVGYGLEEAEILEQIFRASRSRREIRHYLLFPFFSSASELYEHLNNYYLEHHSVKVIGYCIDRSGRKQITEVIKDWARELVGIIREPGFIEKTKIIDEALDE